MKYIGKPTCSVNFNSIAAGFKLCVIISKSIKWENVMFFPKIRSYLATLANSWCNFRYLHDYASIFINIHSYFRLFYEYSRVETFFKETSMLWIKPSKLISKVSLQPSVMIKFNQNLFRLQKKKTDTIFLMIWIILPKKNIISSR